MIKRLLDHNCEVKNSQLEMPPRKAWNRLWKRSGDALPFARWEILNALQQNPEADGNYLLRVDRKFATTLGISLVKGRRFGFRFFRSNNSEWAQAGQLLVDRSKVTSGCFGIFAWKMRTLPGSFIFLDWVNESVESHRLEDALQQGGMAYQKQMQLKAGLIRLTDDSFEEYFRGLSKTFRKKVRANMRKLMLVDDVQYHCLDQFEVDGSEKVRSTQNGRALCNILQELFDVEHRGWKGQAGSSYNSNHDARFQMLVYCIEAAKSGHLQLHYLTVGSKIAAFDIGFTNGDRFFSYKVSYDPQFAKYSPGQLLTYEQLQHWFEAGSIKFVDTVGELSDATKKWCNDSIERNRYLISTGGWYSNLVVKAYAKGKPLLKKLLRR